MLPIIDVKDLTKRYKKAESNALNGISFTVEEGSFFTLLGENGAGKTTTLSILTTMLLPTSGSVRIAEYDVITQADKVRQNIGIIFQQPSLDLNLTAEENIRFHVVLYGLYPFRLSFRLMPRRYQQQVDELAQILGIAKDIYKPVRTFSGGMRRKLEILRSLMHKPRLLLLDEPTTGLDPVSRRGLWDYLKRVREESGETLILTTHYLEEAEQADTICILSHGEIIAYGSMDSVKSELVYECLYINAAPDRREDLRAEMNEKHIDFNEENQHFRLDISRLKMHGILKRIDTPLTHIQPHTPSLEDAYVAITTNGRTSQS